MVCPNCSKEQSEGAAECGCCGLIFAKWKPRSSPEAPPPQPPAWAVGAAACALLTSLALSYRMVQNRSAATISSSPCRRVLRYRIGSVDPRFKVSRENLASAFRPAAAVWEQAAGHALFELDESAAFTINMAYDDRQIIAEDRELAAWRAQAGHDQYLELQGMVARKKGEFDARRADFEREAEEWTRRGRITPEARGRLEAERAALLSLQAEINSLAEAINGLVWASQQTAARYNERRERNFIAADCSTAAITVYQLKDADDLTLKLAHELGHALGLQHVADPKSIMYYLLKEQDPKTLALSAEDRSALAAECSK